MTVAPQDAGFGLWEALIALGMLVFNLIGAAIGGTWALSRSRQKVNEKIDYLALDLERRMNAESDNTLRNVGETAAAIRQNVSEAREKIREVELYVRDNFVSKTTFSQVMQDMKIAWQRFEDKLDKRDERFDKRLDAIDDKLNRIES